ncbi:lysozyme-like [Culicoides brevitarsis]|uniref:lysozyme-like n=1 Tax=Culicoides brevitarsis TaxID=469753 RepID=UPI00307B2BE2
MCLINNNNHFTVKLVAFGLVLLLQSVSAKEYKRCEVTNILKDNGFDRSLLPAWVCLVDAESGRNTDKITTHGYHKSYGLFAIQSMDYCTPGKKNGGGLCKSDCNDFINDNILDDMTCAKKIQAAHGFKVWPKYETSCKGVHLQSWIDDVNKCLNGKILMRNDFDTTQLIPDPDHSAANINTSSFITGILLVTTTLLMLH